MQAKRINNWLNNAQLKSCLKKQNILEWLNEEGSITAKISSDSKFKLKILSDDIGNAEDEEYLALNIPSQKVRIREVILYGDLVPLVYARSIIPNQTSSKGYPGLGSIGSKPLGDLLFQSELFIKTHREFAQFQTPDKEVVWGRRTHYLVRGYPLSVMEVFFVAMNKRIAIIELMRLDKPIGIYLLLWPALLALVISTNGNFEYSHLLIVITGSILVRSAGCVINDIWDQDLDGDVERTKTRPIPSKKLSISESWAVFVALGVLSLMLLSLTNTNTIFISICFGLMIVLYPLTKRFFIGPQIFLGLTFNPTIIVYAMTNELNNPTMIFLYFAIAAKTIAFDSFYGLCDIEDDKKLGIHSTPLWWGSKTLLVIAILQFTVISLFLIVGLKAELSFAWYIGIILLSGFYFYQHRLASQKKFLLAFKNNHWASFYLLILSVFCFLII